MPMTKSPRAMINLMQTFGSFLSQVHRSHGGARMASEKLLPGTRKSKRASCLAMSLMLLSSLALVDVSGAASRQRFDGFETYPLGNMTAGVLATTGVWQSDSGRIMPDVVSSSLDGVTGTHSGSKMCRFNYDTLQGATLNEYQSLQHVPTGVAYTNELFYRYWIRFDADHGISPPGTESKFARIFTTSPVYNDVFYDFAGSPSAPEFDLVVLVNGSYIGGKTYISTPTAFTQWQKMEMYLNFSTGTLRVWLNGNQVFTTSGANLSAGRWLDFYPQSNWGGVNNNGYRHGSNNHFYFDDFEIYSDVGTGATGNMSDATIKQGGSADSTPPAIPVNLRIQ